MQSPKKINKHNLTSGFGLIELMVSVGIVTMVMGIVVARQSSYDGAVLLRSQAYEIALQARETQLLAVSAVGQTGDYRNVYGLYFNAQTPNSYYTYKDEDGDYYFDIEDDLIIGRHNVDARFEIDAVNTVSGASESSVGALSIVFERPNFDAGLYTYQGPVSSGVSSVQIDVRLKGTEGSGVGAVRTVEISKTGQIIVMPVVVESDGVGGGHEQGGGSDG